MKILVQPWTESEAGWGCRPDGLSLHFSEEQRLACIKDYEDRLKKMYGSNIPKEYSYPDGRPYYATVVTEHASESITASVLKGETFWTWENNPKWLRKV